MISKYYADKLVMNEVYHYFEYVGLDWEGGLHALTSLIKDEDQLLAKLGYAWYPSSSNGKLVQSRPVSEVNHPRKKLIRAVLWFAFLNKLTWARTLVALTELTETLQPEQFGLEWFNVKSHWFLRLLQPGTKKSPKRTYDQESDLELSLKQAAKLLGFDYSKLKYMGSLEAKSILESTKSDFKKLIMELHPDRTNNDPEKTNLFKALTSIYNELKVKSARVAKATKFARTRRR